MLADNRGGGGGRGSVLLLPLQDTRKNIVVRHKDAVIHVTGLLGMLLTHLGSAILFIVSDVPFAP